MASVALRQGEVFGTSSLAAGQTMLITPEGTIDIRQGGAPNVMTIAGESANTAWTAGIALQSSTEPLLVCGFPLPGRIELIPLPRLALAITTDPTGIKESPNFSQGLLVDFAAENARAVGFDIDTGWTKKDWAKAIGPGDLFAQLIVPL